MEHDLSIPRDPSEWPVRHFYAMGSHMQVRLAADDAVAARPLALVEARFAAAERALSRFDATSELTEVNAQAGAWIKVSPLFWQVLTAALAMAAETGGLFDPTLLAALEAAGYTRSFEQMQAASSPTQDAVGEANPGTGHWLGGQYSQIQLREHTQMIRLPTGAKLDFGGIAKGFVAQEAVAFLRRWGPALVDAGGDLVASDAPPGYPGWPVAVAAPESDWRDGETDTGADLATVWLANAALATSGIDYRTWELHGRRLHHIIDPTRGEPAQTDLITVSVLAADAIRAEAWAKVALILGRQQGRSALTAHNLAGVLVDGDGHMHMTPALQPWLAVAVPQL